MAKPSFFIKHTLNLKTLYSNFLEIVFLHTTILINKVRVLKNRFNKIYDLSIFKHIKK
jgi:hypothetical protein